MNYLSVAKKMQLEWKLTSKALPREARAPGLYRSRMYPFCFPLELAAYNLFHEIRDDALATFERLGIVWHGAALPGLPTNHTCSSQIFCVNALFPFRNRPEALADFLRPQFPEIKRMLPVEEDAVIAFEWQGDINYLGEESHVGADRIRGAGSTSIDAAMCFETMDDRKVFLLCEVKFTESYSSQYKRFRSDGSDRVDTYREIFYGPFTPFNLEVVPRIEYLLYEPMYQLARHQLLASRILEVGIPEVDNVVVVHIAVGANRELRSITSPHYRKFSRDLYELWPTLLLMPDEFRYIPTEQLFRYVPTDRHPELEPWARYMKSRYSFLK
ncbi:MAG TPA: hypothetical protein PKV86_03040 [Syntrophobacteraceae bacterium]|nr:hypothetical protein [Syntrophobacteraceae bacterium]